jgi:sulfite oxidase
MTPTAVLCAQPRRRTATYRLVVRGGQGGPLSLSLGDCAASPRQTVAASAMRRQPATQMLALRDIPAKCRDLEPSARGVGGSASTTSWSWPAFAPGVAHVAFTGLDGWKRRGRRFGFGASIPLDKALGAEVLLVDNERRAADAAPRRAAAPDRAPARAALKWLGESCCKRIRRQHFQAVAYQHFRPRWTRRQRSGAGDAGRVVCQRGHLCSGGGASLPGGPTTVSGYAVGHGGCPVERVELSADGGQTWAEAALRSVRRPWTWQLWSATVRLVAGPQTLVARAIDSDGHTQPADVGATWNYKGYMNNAWHRVEVNAG